HESDADLRYSVTKFPLSCAVHRTGVFVQHHNFHPDIARSGDLNPSRLCASDSMLVGPRVSASVGKGTVKLVPVPEGARACAIAVPPRVKLTTGKPKPEFLKPPLAMAKLACGVARLIGLGVIELTPRVSLIMSEVVAARLKLPVPV